jgi:hypothetical protein
MRSGCSEKGRRCYNANSGHETVLQGLDAGMHAVALETSDVDWHGLLPPKGPAAGIGTRECKGQAPQLSGSRPSEVEVDFTVMSVLDTGTHGNGLVRSNVDWHNSLAGRAARVIPGPVDTRVKPWHDGNTLS